MKKQAVNPYLPSWEYIPDGEPHVFGGRVYIYGSHDKFNGVSFCLNDYVGWSAPVDDLSDWRYEGVTWRKKQAPGLNIGFMNSMFASDCCRGPDGRYYLYYFIGFKSVISVAVCDTPAGKFEFLGRVKYADGKVIGSKKEPLQFDPAIFVDDDGRVYLYTGFGPVKAPPFMLGKKPTVKGAMCFELEPDMTTVKSEGFTYIGVPAEAGAKGTPYEGHGFFEAASMRKFNGKYYFVYSSILGHELCYAVSDNPMTGFKYGGTLVSNGDIGVNGHTNPKDAGDFTGNTHGGLVEANGKYYVFYHRQTNRHQFSRQACAEEIKMNPDGGFEQAERTSCGLNGGPLRGEGKYEARIACVLKAKQGNRFYMFGKKNNEPYFTQTGADREDNPDQYIANFGDGCTAGFKYFDLQNPKNISVTVKGAAKGKLSVTDNEYGGNTLAEIEINPSKQYFGFSAPLIAASGKTALFFKFAGAGTFDFKEFELR